MPTSTTTAVAAVPPVSVSTTQWNGKTGKNNNFRKNDDHSNLTNGTLDFNEIFKVIKSQNINPTFVLEMFTEEDIRKSVEIFNKLYLN